MKLPRGTETAIGKANLRDGELNLSQACRTPHVKLCHQGDMPQFASRRSQINKEKDRRWIKMDVLLNLLSDFHGFVDGIFFAINGSYTNTLGSLLEGRYRL